ncbi:MAG: ADP-forming succinate--CoA ligase subunit beta, partial [Sphingomicrobium sp.]
RGKAGGIKLAKDRAEAEEYAGAILGMDIRGFTVHELYVESASEIDEEYYAAVVFDRSAKKPTAMLSRMGGMDVEEVAEKDPEAMHMLHVDPLLGFQDFHARRLAFEAGVDGDLVRPLSGMLAKLYETFVAEDAMLIEVNPLIVTKEGNVMALDAKLNFDENALFRQKEIASQRDPAQEDERERAAAKFDLNYVTLEGNIGCMVNGAGLAMATMDIVKLHGGQPANFLDVGGGTTAEKVTEAFKLITASPEVKAIFINIFGGIVKCDLIAEGIITACKQTGLKLPVVARLQGTNMEKGQQLLRESGLAITPVSDLTEAAQTVVKLAQGK